MVLHNTYTNTTRFKPEIFELQRINSQNDARPQPTPKNYKYWTIPGNPLEYLRTMAIQKIVNGIALLQEYMRKDLLGNAASMKVHSEVIAELNQHKLIVE